jgi:hypothetical protein
MAALPPVAFPCNEPRNGSARRQAVALPPSDERSSRRATGPGIVLLPSRMEGESRRPIPVWGSAYHETAS